MDTILAGYPENAPAEEQVAWLKGKVVDLYTEARSRIAALEARQAEIERRVVENEARIERQDRRIVEIEALLDSLHRGDGPGDGAAAGPPPTRH